MLKYKEVYKDLFSVSLDYYLMQCISADFVCGAGIALGFNRIFNMKNMLRKNAKINHWDGHGYTIILPDIPVFNLITKQYYYHKPTYETLRESLEDAKIKIQEMDIKQIAIPAIGCGIDELEWDKVSAIIQDVFKDVSIEILVCSR